MIVERIWVERWGGGMKGLGVKGFLFFEHFLYFEFSFFLFKCHCVFNSPFFVWLWRSCLFFDDIMLKFRLLSSWYFLFCSGLGRQVWLRHLLYSFLFILWSFHFLYFWAFNLYRAPFKDPSFQTFHLANYDRCRYGLVKQEWHDLERIRSLHLNKLDW